MSEGYIKEMRKYVGHAPIMTCACGVIIENENGEILLQKRRDNGCWAIIGGAMEMGETFEETVRREAKEESGLTLGKLELFKLLSGKDCIIEYPNGDICFGPGIVFITKEYEGDITNDPEEVVEHRFFKRTELPDNLNKYDKDIILDWAGDDITEDVRVEHNCCFTDEKRWFRYRAAAIIVEEGYVLFAGNEKDDYYYSIGGGVHMGETAEDAVKREVYEETGIHYEIDRLAVIHENFFNDNRGALKDMDCHEIAFFYMMKPRGTRELNSDSYTQGVRESMHWLPIDELDKYKAFPSFMKEYLQTEHTGIEHIITDERTEKRYKYPSREEAGRLLKEAESLNPGPWGNHSRTAAHCAEAIAARSGMNPDKAYVLGLLHDIGRRFGKRHLGHVSDGYSYMMSLGYDDVARICLTHSFNEKDITKYVGNFDTTEEETALIKARLNAIELDDYDRLIQLCDSIAGAEGIMDQVERMTDVKNRYGAYDQEKWDTNIRLRKHFEDMMGEDLYIVVDKEGYKPE